MILIYKGQTIADVGGSGGSGTSEEVYSTEETRIGTWIDGKPLYRKVVNGALGSYLAVSDIFPLIDDDFTASGDKEFKRIYGYFTDKHNNLSYQFPTRDCSAFVLASYNRPCIQVDSERASAGTPYIAVFEYTKTTDEATS